MKKTILTILLALGFVSWAYKNKVKTENVKEYFKPSYVSNNHGCRDEVIMYSLTTCGICKGKIIELQKSGVPFRVYNVDTNAKLKNVFFSKARKAGYKKVYYPIFEVNNKLLSGTTPTYTLKNMVCT